MPAFTAIVFLAIIGIAIPFLAWQSKKVLDAGAIIPRMPFYLQAIVLQFILFAIAVGTAFSNGLHVAFTLPIQSRPWAIGGWVLVAAVAILIIGWSAASNEARDRVSMIVPRSALERLVWIAVCASAAIAEETAYRGTLLRLLEQMTGDWTVGAVIASILFGLAHLLQGWKSVPFVIVFGFVLHLVTGITGSLAICIIIHFSYDMAAGLIIPMLPDKRQQS